VASVQHELAGGSDGGPSVPLTTTLRWRIDRADSCHESWRASGTYKADWLFVLPEEKASLAKSASNGFLQLLTGLLGRDMQLLVEMRGPGNQKQQLRLVRGSKGSSNWRVRNDLMQLVDALPHTEGRLGISWLQPGTHESTSLLLWPYYAGQVGHIFSYPSSYLIEGIDLHGRG